MGSLYVVINAITDDIKLCNVASCSVKSLYIVIFVQKSGLHAVDIKYENSAVRYDIFITT